MAEVILFHHVAGLTEGVRSFAERLRAGGHTVHTPDLFGGETAATIDEGLALVDRIGDEELQGRGRAALAGLPEALVYAGFSYGSGMAQRFAQQRPGARGALLYEGCLPLTGDWGTGPWPDGLRAQVHGMDADPYFALEGDLASAREIAAAAGPGVVEVFTYPGDGHLFTDSSLPAYDKDATALVIERSIAFLDALG
jgi:dienelactone hydrolase